MRDLLLALGLSIPLGACATGTASNHDLRPSLTASLPMAAAAPSAGGFGREEEASSSAFPVGVGLTSGPSTMLLGAAYDVPIDENLSAGIAGHFGYDSDVTLFAPYAKIKYHLPGTMPTEDGETMRLLPHLTVGVGGVYMDKKGRSSDTSLLINAGAGLRFLTGEKYRIGSEALLNWAPDKVADERMYLSWEIIQVVFDF